MGTDDHPTSLQAGAELIRRFAKNLPDAPGVYRMLDAAGDVLYVGKAKSLKKRVVSYARTEMLPVRLQRMIALLSDMAFVHTHTEAEALLLESNLIKKLKPRYNVLLRDDKSFPYILLTADHDFPLLTKHRGAQNVKGKYFGPFASGGAVNETLAILQKAFMLRNCSDAMFASRKRPCLQYHIKRCTAPCVALVSKENYARQVAQARDFLSGKSREVQDDLARQMQDASTREDYEEAALLRDRIRALTSIQARQDINVSGLGDADIQGFSRKDGRTCIQVFFFRAGQNFGNRAYFPRHAEDDSDETIMASFLAQFYESRPIPPEIVVGMKLGDKKILEEAFASRESSPAKVEIVTPQRGVRKRLLDFADDNARRALEQQDLRLAGEQALLEKLAQFCGMDEPPARIEVYDNSHTSGTSMVGGMIVAGAEGFRKNAYRKFNIREAQAADDYGMMREVLGRRFARAEKDGEGPGSENWPDLLLIDGGAGQLNAAMDVLTTAGVAGDFAVLAIAKGPDRNAGRETFYMPGPDGVRDLGTLSPDDPLLHYLQRLRDEAHRFAIGAHRARRSGAMVGSALDSIPGVGARRKKALLMYFGSAPDVAAAGVSDLQKVEGISKEMAERIYFYFHEN